MSINKNILIAKMRSGIIINNNILAWPREIHALVLGQTELYRNKLLGKWIKELI